MPLLADKREETSSSGGSQQGLSAGSCAMRQCIGDERPGADQARDEDSGKPTETLRLEYWGRTDECLERKWAHMELVDELFESREELILATTLRKEETVLEPNMFPYNTPEGVEHWTLWSRHEMEDTEVKKFVCSWLRENAPQVESWNYDENLLRSIDIFHVHVYLKGPAQQR